MSPPMRREHISWSAIANELHDIDHSMLSTYSFGDGLGAFTDTLADLGIKRRAVEGVPIDGFPVAQYLRIDVRCFFNGAHGVIVPFGRARGSASNSFRG